VIICEGCEKPIHEGDKVLIIKFPNEDEFIVHKSFVCLLEIEGFGEGIGSFEKEGTTLLETNKDLFDCLIREGLFMTAKCNECSWENIIRPYLKDCFFCSSCGCVNKKEETT